MAKKTAKRKCDDMGMHIRAIYWIYLYKNMNISSIFMSPLDRREVFGKIKINEQETLNFIKKYLDI